MPEARARVILAFDFGLKRIGIATGETLAGTSAPRGTVAMTPAGPDWPAVDRTAFSGVTWPLPVRSSKAVG